VRVLVTGHEGYIGSVAVPMLQAAGHDVVGLDTAYYAGCDLYDPALAVPSLRRDVRDVEAGDLDGFDAVLHLAGLSNDPLGDLDPELTFEINHLASVRIAELAREAGVERFIFASSCSMYGASGSDAPVDESAPLQPLTAYAESKVRSEKDISALATDDFSPVFMRNATVYGVSPRLRIDLVLNNLVGWAYTTGVVRVLSDGTPWRPLLHVRDLASAAVAILAAPRDLVHNEPFNIGRDLENYRVKELAEIVRDAVTGSTLEIGTQSSPDARSYRVDFGKFHRTFPDAGLSWTAAKGADELLAAYIEAGLRREQLEDESFTRLRRLRAHLDAGELDSSLRWREASAVPMT
jgi:nucleoside-diphosphate-sugar epimerase